MQKIIRVESNQILTQFLNWAKDVNALGVRLITLEGLPHAGKSTLLSMLPSDTFSAVELDRYFYRKVDPKHTWTESIPTAEVRTHIDELLGSSRIVVVEGPAVWELSDCLFSSLESSEIARVYIKQMSRTGEYVDWLAGEILPHAHLHTEAYFRSIYEHHSVEPWKDADLIIERLPEDDPE